MSEKVVSHDSRAKLSSVYAQAPSLAIFLCIQKAVFEWLSLQRYKVRL